MLVDYSVTDMGCFDEYSDAVPRDQKMRGNGINTFILNVAQCINFNQTKFVTATIISEARLKSLYSRLYFKVIIYLVISTNFEKDRKWFHYKSEKSKVLQNQKIDLQCYPTIPKRVTIIYDNLIDFNENRDMLKDLNEVPPSNNWFPCKYIDA